MARQKADNKKWLLTGKWHKHAKQTGIQCKRSSILQSDRQNGQTGLHNCMSTATNTQQTIEKTDQNSYSNNKNSN